MIAAAGLGAGLASQPVLAAPLDPSRSETAPRRALGAEIPDARLLWARDGKLWFTRMGRWRPVVIGPNGGPPEHRPRWSPDGRLVVYQRGSDEVWIMRGEVPPGLDAPASFVERRRLLERAHTADWTGDGKGITAISSDGRRVIHLSLDDGSERVLYDVAGHPAGASGIAQSAVLHRNGRHLLIFRLEPNHASEVIDLETGRALSNDEMRRGDCKPMWAPGGRGIVSTARTSSRPIVHAAFDPETGALAPSRTYIDMDTGLRYYQHDAVFSNDGRYALFGGKVLLGANMSGGREIYAWRVGSAADDVVRLTFDSADDDTPSLFVPR